MGYKKLDTLNTLTLITIIVAITWRVILEHVSFHRWMHIVEWVLIILMFVLAAVQLVYRNKEKKRNKED